ncbi:MAG: HD domain-containing phosphohydrolase [Desulfuromonadales bacterium]|nr:HD domain-containing phosphohydrolase [Desulfuromonadales bacterium]
MNSLKIKFLGLCCVILMVAIGLTTWYNLQTQKAMLGKMAAEHGRMLAETIRNSIITDMANGKNDQVGHILGKIKNESAINNVRIFDESGRILMAASPEEIGDLVSTSELMAYRTGNFSFSSSVSDHEHFNSIVPIYNQQICYSCHDESIKVLGVMNLQLSLDALSNMQSSGRNATMIASGVMLIILILTITAFLLVYVDAPIRRLVSAMDHVEKGQFEEAHTMVSSSDEMTLLSSKFNYMVQRLRELVESTVKNERELAISQEKLAHSEEIHAMNMTLEDRLKEIEYLNINLEERIEEIEEANYKIADLASELEEKNIGLTQAVDRLQALYKMGLAVNATMDLDRLLDLLSQKSMATMKAQVGYILMLNEKTGNLSIGGAAGIPEDFDLGLEIPLKPGGVSFWVMNNNKPKLVEDVDKEREFSKMSRLGFIRESVICAPLTEKDKVIGTITIANPIDGSSFGVADLELLSTIAAQASIAIRNARLYEAQETTYLNTVQALVSAIEASDAYTRGHSERVTRYSIALAKRMGMDGEPLKQLEQAAILHDIGKIGIDVALLHKKEKLTAADIDVLKLHPSIGVRILEPIHFLGTVREIIEQHHERFDGNGYPKGLSGEESRLEGKILAVCDTYDAMTSDRPYRKALSHEVAIQEIRDHSGAQFDPEVAAAFIEICNEDRLQH